MPHFLGFDSSTQSIKAVIIDTDAGEIYASASVNYGTDLPEYDSPEGVLPNADPAVKHSNPLLWVAALDLVLQRLNDTGAPLEKVAGISGAGQQHGSVYLNDTAASALKNSDVRIPLARQLRDIFSRKTSPIWMDGSTAEECRELEKIFGARLQNDTGSPAIERFTGPQIRKFFKNDTAAYDSTAGIHLVSSFLASVLTGVNAPIDSGDGAGMNLLNLHTGNWDAQIAGAIAPNLISKLPKIGGANTIVGHINPYFHKYGFTEKTAVSLWTGDNPASLVGTGAHTAGKAVISLGTSDTFFAAMEKFRTDPDGCGHVFGNPAGGFMALICFKNGSLARDRVRAELGVDWDFFANDAFKMTPPGNKGRLALPWFEPEITPPRPTAGLRANFDFKNAAGAIRIRAIVEAQALALAAHSAWIGRFDTLRVTGGASVNNGILQTLADVFQARVETIAVPNSAALGAAMIAAHSIGAIPYETLAAQFCPTQKIISPRPENAAIYQKLRPALHALKTEKG